MVVSKNIEEKDENTRTRAANGPHRKEGSRAGDRTQ